MTREEAFRYAMHIRNKTKKASVIVLDGECIDAILSTPWHRASEELPKDGQHILIAHKMRNGDYMTEAVWYPEPNITDDMEYWMEIPEVPKKD